MKKNRSQKPTIPISLAGKRASLNQDQLYTPFKIDWKGPQLQPVDNNSSKNFFQNMKNQLSTIKNDFQKLIKKEISLKHQREDSVKSSGYVKNKCQSIFKKGEKNQLKPFQDIEKFQEGKKLQFLLQENQTRQNVILSLEKNLPCMKTYHDIRDNYTSNIAFQQKNPQSSKYISTKEKNVTIKESEVIEQQAKFNQQQQVKINQQQQAKFNQQQQQQAKQNVSLLNQEIHELKLEVVSKQRQIKEYKAQRQKLLQKITVLQQSIKEISLSTEQKSLSNEKQLSSLHTHLSELQNQKCYHIQKLNQLLFHNNNFNNQINDLSYENDGLKQNINSLQRFIEELKCRCLDIENDYKRKIQYIQRQMKQYQKRQDLFSCEIDKLTKKLNQQNTSQAHQNIIHANNQPIKECRCEQMKEENDTFKEEINLLNQKCIHYQRQAEIQKNIHEEVSLKFQEEIKKLNTISLGQEFQMKINVVIEESYKLKNTISQLEAHIQSLNIQNSSLVSEIAIYQERYEEVYKNKSLSTTEWEELVEQIQKLKLENSILTKQLLVFKNIEESSQKQIISEGNRDSFEKLNTIIKDQICKIEQIMKENKKYQEKCKIESNKVESQVLTIQKLQSQIKIQKLKQGNTAQNSLRQEIVILENSHKAVYEKIHLKENELQNMKNFVYNVLCEKVQKVQEESDIIFYMRQLGAFIGERQKNE